MGAFFGDAGCVCLSSITVHSGHCSPELAPDPPEQREDRQSDLQIMIEDVKHILLADPCADDAMEVDKPSTSGPAPARLPTATLTSAPLPMVSLGLSFPMYPLPLLLAHLLPAAPSD